MRSDRGATEVGRRRRVEGSPWRGLVLATGLCGTLLYTWWSPASRGPAMAEVSGETSARADESPVAPAHLERILDEGRSALQGAEPASAVRLFTLAAELDPLSAETWEGLGEACLAAGDAACAGRAYRAQARAARWIQPGG